MSSWMEYVYLCFKSNRPKQKEAKEKTNNTNLQLADIRKRCWDTSLCPYDLTLNLNKQTNNADVFTKPNK